MSKKIIINADDFGYSKKINEGILTAYNNGRLSSVSVMVNGSGFSDSMEKLQLEPELGRGLHITLTTNTPVSDPKRVQSLLDSNGNFYRRGEKFLANMLLGNIDRRELEIEIRNQIERGLQYIDDVDHINSHMHVHMYPTLFSLFVELAEEYNIPAVRLSDEEMPINYNALRSGYLCNSLLSKNIIKKIVISAFTYMHTPSNKIITNSFCGVIHMGNMHEGNIIHFLQSNTDTPVELCVHPGLSDPELSELEEPLIQEREIDLKGLCNKRVATILDRDYDLVRFKDISEQP